MIRMGSVTVIEPLTIGDICTTRLVRIEAFSLTPHFRLAFEQVVGRALPDAGQGVEGPNGVLLWAEAKAWLVEGDASVLEAGLGDVAAVSDVSGAWRRIDIKGSAWRTLMTIEGLLDVESATFKTGSLAASLQHHAPVMLHVVSDAGLSIYTAPSFAHHLHTALHKAARRLAA